MAVNTLIPSKARFDLIRKKFEDSVGRSPICAKIIRTTYDKNGTGYDAIVGNTARTEEVLDCQVLYNRDWDNYTRTKYGIKEDVSAIIYVPPSSLVKKFGTFRLDGKSITVELLEETYLCERIVFQGDIPAYGSCVSVEIRLKDNIEGG